MNLWKTINMNNFVKRRPIMKTAFITIILAAIGLWNINSVYGQASNQRDPVMSMNSANRYQCPNHPEITASWPAECPKCGANLIRREPFVPMNSGRSNAENMRRRIMMNTRIDVFDPEAILGAKKPLKLTNEQIDQLKTISMTARQGALRVLNGKQRRELNALRKLPNYPSTMTQMHRWMMQKLSSSANMMSKMMQQTKTQDPKIAADPPSKTPDPPAEGRIDSGVREFGSRIPQDQLRDNLRDSLRDKYRDEYRDRLRDRFRDQYRDAYRDRLRDNLGGMRGFGNEGFGNNEGFDNDEGFGNEGFGDNEGFNNYEGFGDEGFGNDEGFDNNEGFGDEGFGDNEGFGNDEGFGDESFGNNEGFGGEEGRR
jgi:hypothetical protein